MPERGQRADRQRLVVFVVARPKGDRGVRAQFHHHGGHLALDGAGEFVTLRIERASHAEILPDHYAVFVAEFVEAGVFVDVAAPAADHVAVQVGNQSERAVEPLRVAAVEGVHRGPVAAAGENLLVIDDEAEPARILGRVGRGEIEAHGADADAAAVDVERIAGFVHELHLGVVERRFAIAARPPELDIPESEDVACGMRCHLGAVHGHLFAVAAQ